jgi:hypothetical protein
VLAGLVLVSIAFRAWASRDVTTPWIAPDELAYALLGRSLYATGHLRILTGPTGFLSLVAPALFGVPLSLGNLEAGYSVAKVVDACVMSLAAVPVFLWARSLVSTRWALVGAALTLALPGLAYSGLLMTEVVFYPLLVLAAWSLAAVLESPTRTRQLVFVGLLLVAVLTRVQAVVLVAAFAGALAVEWAIARRVRVRAFWPTFAALGVLALAWLVAKAARGGSLLGGYNGAERHYPVGRALRYVLYHAGDLALLTGFVPFCAVAVLVVLALRRGEPDARLRAYLAVATSLAVTFVVEVGVFASGNVGHLAERDLIGLAPLAFLGFVVWLARGGPGGLPTRAIVAALAVGAVLAIPVGAFVTSVALVDSFTLVPLYHLRELTSVRTTTLVLAIGLVVTALLFAFLPRRLLPVLPALVGLALVAASISASRQVVTESNAQRALYVGPVRRWIDAVATGPVAYLYDQQTSANAAWQTVFWNRRIEAVYDLPPAYVGGPMPQRTLLIAPDGIVRPALDPAYAVVSQRYSLAGEPIAYSPQNADRAGYALWALDGPLQVTSVEAGLEPNGDVDPGVPATLDAFACTRGAFRLTLLAKEAETIRVALTGRPVRARSFASPGVWHVTVPAAGKPTCRLTVTSTGVTGTTEFAFEP